MGALEEGNLFQKEIFKSTEDWNRRIFEIYPSLRVNNIQRSNGLENGLNKIKQLWELEKTLKDIPNKDILIDFVKEIKEKQEKLIIIGDNERGDLELELLDTTYNLHEFKAFLVYKCPVYYRYSVEKPLNKLAIDGLFLKLKKDENGNYFYEIRILEVKLSNNIWPSYLAQVLIYWINLEKFLQQKEMENFFRLKKEVIFILGKKTIEDFKINPYFFYFENARFRLDQLKEIYQFNFNSFINKEIIPPLKPLCFQGEKCPFLDCCFNYIQAEESI